MAVGGEAVAIHAVPLCRAVSDTEVRGYSGISDTEVRGCGREQSARTHETAAAKCPPAVCVIWPVTGREEWGLLESVSRKEADMYISYGDQKAVYDEHVEAMLARAERRRMMSSAVQQRRTVGARLTGAAGTVKRSSLALPTMAVRVWSRSRAT